MQISRPRIVFLNRCFWPDSEATGQLLTDLCEQIADEFEVHVVCGQPNHPLPDAVFLQSGVEVRNRVTMHRLRHTTYACLLYTSPSPRDLSTSRMPSSA